MKQIAYSYDSVDQLTGEVATGGAANSAYSQTFQYDSMGNRTQLEHLKSANTTVSTSVPNRLNQLSAVSRSSGGVTSTTALLHDSAGNLTQTTNSDGSKTLYTYDDADRLWRIEWRNAANAPLRKSEFTYDYASRKAVSAEFLWQAGAWALQSETRRVFDGLDVVQERNGANEVTAQLTRDGNIGGILARSNVAGVSYFGYDGGGNVTLLTDEAGAQVGRYSYDAFGNTLEASGVRAGENPYRFSTKEYHAASGLVDFGYRFYSASTGRWINRDPIEEDGGINLYAMVGNNPPNAVDAYGLAKVEVGYWHLFGVPVGLGYADIYHAYIIVSENDGSNPYIFHGWHGGNFNFRYDRDTERLGRGSGSVGMNGYMEINYGSFGPNWPEYRNHRNAPSQTIIRNDCRRAQYYIDRLKITADAYNRNKVLYDYLGPNSNTAVWQLLDKSIRQPIPNPIAPVPGWNNNQMWK